jgi:hypothetical protein
MAIKLGPVTLCSWRWWHYLWLDKSYYGLFRNKPGVIPGRWGFYILGFEFGSRQPGNKTGVFLKRFGLWRV